MRFKRNSIADFYAPSIDAAAVLEERAKWLRETPEHCIAIESGSGAVLKETIDLLGLPKSTHTDSEKEACANIGRAIEPDFLLLQSDSAGRIRLRCGCVCFPSSWDLQEKIGREIDFIHGVVPGLNAALGNQIQGFLTRIVPGISWDRTNWGLSRSADLNQHPARQLPRLDASVDPSEVFLRIEYQSLVRLPETGAVLFGIRVKVHPLQELFAEPAAAEGLRKALETMPEEMAQYKGLSAARRRVIELLNR